MSVGDSHMLWVEVTNWRPSRIQKFALGVYTLGFAFGWYAHREWSKG